MRFPRHMAYDPGPPGPRQVPDTSARQRPYEREGFELFSATYPLPEGLKANAPVRVASFQAPRTGVDIVVRPCTFVAQTAWGVVRLFAQMGDQVALVDSLSWGKSAPVRVPLWGIAYRGLAETLAVEVELSEVPGLVPDNSFAVSGFAGAPGAAPPADLGVYPYNTNLAGGTQFDPGAGVSLYGGTLNDLRLFGAEVSNSNAAARWFQVYRGGVGMYSVQVPANGHLSWRCPGGSMHTEARFHASAALTVACSTVAAFGGATAAGDLLATVLIK